MRRDCSLVQLEDMLDRNLFIKIIKIKKECDSMNSKFCHDSEMTSRRSGIESLMMKCPICGREFSCNKTYHVYTALLARKRQYYCSYSCFNKRPNPRK